MDTELIQFFEKRIAQFKELEALVDEIGRLPSASMLGEKYRTLIERVRAAWEETKEMASHNERVFAQDPKLRSAPAVGWFNSVHSALMAAATHVRPAVNSRNLPKIQSAAYVIGADLSMCRHDMEAALKLAKGAGGGAKNT